MSVYNFTVLTPDGAEVSLKEYSDKVLLVVNTASFCGYTKQLMGLQRDYEAYKEQGYEVLAFPSNQFRNQEPDPMDIILQRYHEEYGVTFPIFQKIQVNGPETHPLYKYLKEQLPFDPTSKTPLVMKPIYRQMDPEYKTSSDIKWNFTKFLIDRNGNPVKRFEPEVTPSHLQKEIESLL